ncbi:MAG: VWA domain-containing protein [Chloroflexi bacterium]|nr:MAG: VWA domain-containing protein [Chloroflexota bacterium]
MTVHARPDRRLVRAAHRSERFVLVEVVAPAAPRTERQPVNLAFVLDRSGSMSGAKIDLGRKAVEDALARLHPEDRFAIVVYDEQIDLVVESAPASAEARRNAVERLRAIDARGSTDLAGGWLRGCEQVALHLAGHGVNRALLLTDGLANVGITDSGELERHAAQLRERGVTTSTFGVGDDFDERLLQAMADAGGGHFYYIADAAQIADHITSEVGEVLQVVARSAFVEVTAADGLDVEPLTPYRVERRGNRTHVTLGDLVSEQELAVVLRLRFPYGEMGREIGALLAVADADGALSSPPVTLSWTYADDAANDAQPRDRAVDRAVANVFAARARQVAVSLNRAGQYAAARAAIQAVAQRVTTYAGDDPELHGLVAQLDRDEDQWAAPAPEAMRKAAFAASSYLARGRSPAGHAQRRS